MPEPDAVKRSYTMNGVTATATERRPSDRDDKKYMRQVTYDGNTRIVHYGDPDMQMRRNNEEARRNFLSRHNCDAKSDPFAPGFWACYDWKNTSEGKNTAVKLIDLTEDTAVIGGYGVVFDGTDLDGEAFTKSTDFMLDLVPKKLVFYDHSLRPEVKHALGLVKSTDEDDFGLWVEAELDRNREYVAAVLELVQKGAIGWSSGSVPHLVQRNGKTIKRWPIVEFSLTPTPAEPRTLGVDIIKSLAEADPSLEALLPETASAAVEDNEATEEESADAPIIEVTDMTTETQDQAPPDVAEDDRLTALEERMNEKFEALMQHLESSKSARLRDVGYIAPDDEEEKPEVKSLGDFLLAVRRKNYKRIAKVYGSAIKDIDAEGDASVLVPEEYNAALLQVAFERSPILNQITRQTVSAPAGRYPALDTTVTPTAGAGNTALAAGISSVTTEPGGTYTETQPTFYELNFQVTKVGGYVEVDDEIVADSAFAIEQLLTNLFRINIESKLEYYILNGTGAGEPMGIINAPVAIGITPDTDNTLAYADVLEIMSRFKPIQGQGVFIVHPGLWPDIGVFEIGSNGAGLPQGVGTGDMMRMPGTPYRLIMSEHLPQDDNAGCAVLADLGSYILFERQQLQVAYSAHAAFTSGMGTWRFDVRCDGMPWLKNAITLADPQGSYTVSPFVYLND